MLAGAPEAASFIPTLYKTLQEEGLSGVKIACCDAEGWPDQVTITEGLMADGMEKYLDLITSHMYTGDPDSLMPTKLPVWMTEGADLSDAFCTTWYSDGGACEGLTWAQKIHTGFTSADLSAYIYWEGVEINATTSSSHLIDSDGTDVTASGRLWAFAMWSRFVRPGAYRVGTTGSVTGVDITAFKNMDGSVVLVSLNTAPTAQDVSFKLNGFSPLAAEAYVTDNEHIVELTKTSLVGGAVEVSVPPHGMVTVKLEPAIGGWRAFRKRS